MNMYALAADLLVGFHLLYVAFCVGGLVLILIGAAAGWAWVRNRRFRLIHFAAVGLVAVEAAVGLLCPLTTWEYELRQLAGQSSEQAVPLVARLIRASIFVDLPAWVLLSVYLVFAGVVGAAFVLIRPKQKVLKKSQNILQFNKNIDETRYQ